MDRQLDIVDKALLLGAGAIALFLVLLGVAWVGLSIYRHERPRRKA